MVCMTVILIMDDHIRRLRWRLEEHTARVRRRRIEQRAILLRFMKERSRAQQTKETMSKFNLLNMRRLCPCRTSKHFRQGAELPTTNTYVICVPMEPRKDPALEKELKWL